MAEYKRNLVGTGITALLAVVFLVLPDNFFDFINV